MEGRCNAALLAPTIRAALPAVKRRAGWPRERLQRNKPVRSRFRKTPPLTNRSGFVILTPRPSIQPGAKGEFVMAKGQMRSNKEKKKPKADKNLKKGGAAPSPFASGKTPAGQNPGKKGCRRKPVCAARAQAADRLRRVARRGPLSVSRRSRRTFRESRLRAATTHLIRLIANRISTLGCHLPLDPVTGSVHNEVDGNASRGLTPAEKKWPKISTGSAC